MNTAAFTPTAPSAPSGELQFAVSGMTCASCVNRVERALRKVPGVEGAEVNLAAETATDPAQPGVGAGRDGGRHVGPLAAEPALVR